MRITEPKEFYFPLRGGLDLVTPPYQVQPGKMLSCMRYEIAASGGYKPIDGYERLDGRGLPSEAVFQLVHFTDPELTLAAGTVVVGAISGAVGISLAAGLVDIGAGLQMDLTGKGLFLVTGEFVKDEDILVDAVVVGTLIMAEYTNSMNTDAEERHCRWLAVEKVRAGVVKVPGYGPLRGVWRYKGKLYAFRDDETASECLMYVEDAVSGWQLIVTPTLEPGGIYQFENTNFGGAANTVKMYGCDGINKAFEFDGTTFTQITTGMVLDAPFLLAEHKKHLFLAFPNGSLQHSPPTEPTGVWSVVLNAGELGMGEEITAIKSLPGDMLGIWCRDSIHLLSGTGVGSWVLAIHAKETGGFRGTVQNVGRVLFLNNTGLAELSATNVFGSFKSGTISSTIHPLLDKFKANAVASVVVPGKNQYRVFYADGYAITATFMGRDTFFTQSQYNVPVRCISAPSRADDEMGAIYFGSDDGYVYKMDSGLSSDHKPMNAYFRLPYSHQGAPRQKKRYREVAVELDVFVTGELNLLFVPDFSLTQKDIPRDTPDHPAVAIRDVTDSLGIWDESDWNVFSWDSTTGGGGGTATARVNGVAKEMGLQLFFKAETTVTPLHVLNGVFISYNFLGRVR